MYTIRDIMEFYFLHFRNGRSYRSPEAWSGEVLLEEKMNGYCKHKNEIKLYDFETDKVANVDIKDLELFAPMLTKRPQVFGVTAEVDIHIFREYSPMDEPRDRYELSKEWRTFLYNKYGTAYIEALKQKCNKDEERIIKKLADRIEEIEKQANRQIEMEKAYVAPELDELKKARQHCEQEFLK